MLEITFSRFDPPKNLKRNPLSHSEENDIQELSAGIDVDLTPK